jgi:hypothetical protein
MRQAMLAVSLMLAMATAGGCIVHHRHRGPSRGRNCRTECASYGHRRVCNRRCRVWRNGVCASYRQQCRRTRYCRRHVTRCR